MINRESNQGLVRGYKGRLGFQRRRVRLLEFELGSSLIEHIPEDQEAGSIVCSVLDVFHEHVRPVLFCREAIGNGSPSFRGLLGDNLRRLGRGRDILSLDALEVFRQEGFALAPRLRVCV